MTDHAEFQAAVTYTVDHLERVEPLRLRFFTLVTDGDAYHLLVTKPLVRVPEHKPLGSLDPLPDGYDWPTTPWGVLKDAASGGPCLTHGSEGDLYLAAFTVACDEMATDLLSAQVLVRQVAVLIAAKVGVQVKSFAELPGADSSMTGAAVQLADAQGAATDGSWPEHVEFFHQTLAENPDYDLADLLNPNTSAFANNDDPRRAGSRR